MVWGSFFALDPAGLGWGIRDTDGDDRFDEFKLLRKLNVGYEHSAHSIIVSEDGEGLYLVSGNYTRVPDGVPSLQPPVWAKDSLLPAMPDPMGHAVTIKAPGGWVCRISPDGHMYFLTGGRNTDSKLYRVRNLGERDGSEPRQLVANRKQRALRHSLERYHGDDTGGLKAVEAAWPHLADPDRNIRYAARLAIENQQLGLWREKVFAESDPRAVIHASIALARHGDPSLSGPAAGQAR